MKKNKTGKKVVIGFILFAILSVAVLMNSNVFSIESPDRITGECKFVKECSGDCNEIKASYTQSKIMEYKGKKVVCINGEFFEKPIAPVIQGVPSQGGAGENE
jgi:uncharacterized low-complexity protein